MQYDAIILELMSRIQTLEKEVEAIKARLDGEPQADASAFAPPSPPRGGTASRRQLTYSKMTDDMVKACYRAGKEAYGDPSLDLSALAGEVSASTGMNRSSAFIYIYVVVCMLRGEVYKRAISTAATEEYLDTIFSEFGQAGLDKALFALREHIAYRNSIGHTVGGLIALYNKYIV